MRYYFLGLATLVVVCVGCAGLHPGVIDNKEQYTAPPAGLLQRPGPMVDGPGPGVMPMLGGPPLTGGMTMSANMPIAGMPGGPLTTKTTQVKFVGPRGTKVGWKIRGGYAENQLLTPGIYNFLQGATYRLKLRELPGRDGMVIYPTLQVYPSHPTTDAYLAHNAVPIELTDEDLDQIASNNFVTKVIYLPDPRYQELAIAGVETLVSTRLEPGVDPVAEADRRGTILAVLRVGNMNLEMNAGAPVGPDGAAIHDPDGVQQVGFRTADGASGQFEPPVPIGPAGNGMHGVPGPMIVANNGFPGMPPGPIAGVGGTPVWGMPMTGTPIGLPGPAHLPYGGPAGLKSHTVRNHTKMDLGKPVEHMVIDVKHEPGYRLPKPVSHIEYTEKHPTHRPGSVAYPAWANPNPAVGPDGAYCPPGMMPGQQ